MGNLANRRKRRQSNQIGIPEAADYCGVHYRTVRRWISEGRLNAVRVGPKLLKVNISDLEAIMRPVGGGAS